MINCTAMAESSSPAILVSNSQWHEGNVRLDPLKLGRLRGLAGQQLEGDKQHQQPAGCLPGRLFEFHLEIRVHRLLTGAAPAALVTSRSYACGAIVSQPIR